MTILDKALSKIFGTKHERDIKAMKPRVSEITSLEGEVQNLTDDGLRERIREIQASIQTVQHVFDAGQVFHEK